MQEGHHKFRASLAYMMHFKRACAIQWDSASKKKKEKEYSSNPTKDTNTDSVICSAIRLLEGSTGFYSMTVFRARNWTMVSLKCPHCVRWEDFTKGKLGKSPSAGTSERVNVSAKQKEAERQQCHGTVAKRAGHQWVKRMQRHNFNQEKPLSCRKHNHTKECI